MALAPSSSPTTPDFAEFEQIAQRLANQPPNPDPDLSWRQVASCRDTSPELFFPIGTTGQAIDQIEAAKYVCMGCPARVECLVNGERVRPQPGGFYGGWITSELVGPFKGESGSSDW